MDKIRKKAQFEKLILEVVSENVEVTVRVKNAEYTFQMSKDLNADCNYNDLQKMLHKVCTKLERT